VADGRDHGSGRGDDVVDQNRRVLGPARDLRDGDSYVSVAAADFVENDVGGPDPSRHLRNPLRAFAVQTDQEWLLHLLPDPLRE
jgi:hypothetical protein